MNAPLEGALAMGASLRHYGIFDGELPSWDEFAARAVYPRVGDIELLGSCVLGLRVEQADIEQLELFCKQHRCLRLALPSDAAAVLALCIECSRVPSSSFAAFVARKLESQMPGSTVTSLGNLPPPLEGFEREYSGPALQVPDDGAGQPLTVPSKTTPTVGEADARNIDFDWSLSFWKFQSRDMDPHRGNWSDFKAFVREYAHPDKGNNYVCFTKPEHRCRENETPTTVLVLDIDKAPPTEHALIKQWCRQWETLWSPTHSNTPEKPRARAYLLANRAMEPYERRTVHAAVEAQLRLVTGMLKPLDDCVARCSQPVFLPPSAGGCEEWSGALLDVDALIASVPENQRERPASKEPRSDVFPPSEDDWLVIERTLESIPPSAFDPGGGRERAIRLGAALKTAGDEERAFGLWVATVHKNEVREAEWDEEVMWRDWCRTGADKTHWRAALTQAKELGGEIYRTGALDDFGNEDSPFEAVDEDSSNAESPDCDDSLAEPGTADVERAVDDDCDTEPEKPVRKPRFRVLSVAQLNQLPPAAWLIKGVLPQAGLALLYGPTSCGKTFSALDMALAVSRGEPWRGKRVAQGAVVYVAAEASTGIRTRLNAYGKFHSVPVDTLPVVVIPDTVNVLQKEDVGELLQAIRAHDFGGVPLRLVVLDTLNRVAGGADENSTQDMSLFIKNAQRIADRLGVLVLIVHHSGKDADRGSRGSSAVPAAMDTILAVKVQGEARVLVLEKQRDGESGGEFAFRLQPVKLGVDDDLDDITSCVSVPSDASLASAGRGRKLGKLQQAVMDAAHEMSGQLLDESAPVPRDALLKEAERRISTGSAPPDRRQVARLNEALDQLIEQRRLVEGDGGVCVPS